MKWCKEKGKGRPEKEEKLDSYKFVHIVLDIGAEVRYNKANFLQIVLELISQDPWSQKILVKTSTVGM